MASRPLDCKRAEFMERAGEAFDRMFGTDGQNGLVTFDQREQRACEATDALARWLMAEHLSEDPAAGPPDADAPCPLCGEPLCAAPREGPPGERREVQTRRGPVAYHRHALRCRRCRRIFFPPG